MLRQTEIESWACVRIWVTITCKKSISVTFLFLAKLSLEEKKGFIDNNSVQKGCNTFGFHAAELWMLSDNQMSVFGHVLDSQQTVSTCQYDCVKPC